MDYFNRFPSIPYTLTEYNNNRAFLINRSIPNMTVKLQLQNFSTEVQRLPFVMYRIQDSERPDTIAAKFYGSSHYVWVIFLANNMRNWYDWPMNNFQFQQYMAKKYESAPGLLNGVIRSQNTVTPLPDTKYVQIIDGIKYYVNRETYLTLGIASRSIETVYQQEEEANDVRREIKLIEPRILNTIETKFIDLMQK